MGNYEQRDNSGSLFKNDRREKETHPHAKGRAMIGGVMYWISAWTKEDRNGNKYQSLSFTEMDDQGGGGGGGSRQQARGGASGNGGGGRGFPMTDAMRERQANAPRPTQPFGDEMEFKEDDIPF